MKMLRSIGLTTIAALAFIGGKAMAAPPTVEILAMKHPPVRAALLPLREWLAMQGAKLKVIETDIESPPGQKRLSAIGLAGHIPIVILIDGQFRHLRKDGSVAAFINFPAIKDAPPGVRGDWSIADVQLAASDLMKRP